MLYAMLSIFRSSLSNVFDVRSTCFHVSYQCLRLDLSFPCVLWLDPHVSMLVYMSIFLSYMLYALYHV